MISYTPKELETRQLHQYMLGAIAPRPIAFASTIDKDGVPNLSPFSFFNAFGVNPTTLIFSPARRGTNNTTKDTFENLKEIPEVVINIVNYNLVQQANLCSNNFPHQVDEFVKAGLQAIPSDIIRPYRVKESPVQFECKVREIIETSTNPGAANLIICEIVKLHISEAILDDDGKIDPNKIKVVGRMGFDNYCKAFGDSVFQVPKPGLEPGIGIDSLPTAIKNSPHLSGFDLGILGNEKSLPDFKELNKLKYYDDYQAIRIKEDADKEVPLMAKQLLINGHIRKALTILYDWATNP